MGSTLSTKPKVGRKPKIQVDDVTLKKVETLAAQGLTEKQIYQSMGVSHDTFYRCKREKPELSDALKRGQSKGIAVVTNALFTKCREGNIAAMIFYLKNRDRENWSDNPESKPQSEALPITVTVGDKTKPPTS